MAMPSIDKANAAVNCCCISNANEQPFTLYNSSIEHGATAPAAGPPECFVSQVSAVRVYPKGITTRGLDATTTVWRDSPRNMNRA